MTPPSDTTAIRKLLAELIEFLQAALDVYEAQRRWDTAPNLTDLQLASELKDARARLDAAIANCEVKP